MKQAANSLQDLVHVIGHKILETLRYYLEKPTLQDKENYVDNLFKYTGTEQQSDSDLLDFDISPPPPKKKIKNKQMKTNSNNNQTKQN